ncbi:PIG-L family deacetylase [Mucilaginibacter sp. BT774]|uniref:PIG-L family deacetylase n=1 Tax=Mucilaginibacter sp. BT774 TaxID=3062276 RepID=UPI0026752E05|nr:PIG-L family deacetylase [Mucilaginibacter sp. BT774]MDO3626786.1 PIG-L family deacetylase [Mucilaginibacter sp. BT774]
MKKLLFLLLIFSFFGLAAFAQASQRVLVVIAHPDDESVLSVTLYKLAKEQQVKVDLFVITNGEAGYKYSTLAEQYYGCPLTNQAAARKNLPAIRKKELREAGKILGLNHIFYGNQHDSHFSLNEHEPLDTSWNVLAVKKQLNHVLVHGHYDEVLCLLPEQSTHGGHKAATLLALEAVSELPVSSRPLILGAALRDKGDTSIKFNQLKNYDLTRTIKDGPSFTVDRTVSFGYGNKTNYKIVANWELAAHKSQGATEMTMNDGDLEEFWLFALNLPGSENIATKLFTNLSRSPYSTGEPDTGQLASRSKKDKD